MDAERAAELRAQIAVHREDGFTSLSGVDIFLDELEALLPPSPPSRDPATCQHDGFAGAVNVNFLADVGVFSADITITCAMCGLPFSFKGVSMGWSPEQPTVSVDATELRAPIEPGPKPIPLGGLAVFIMPQKPMES